ncbi:MAG: AMP-binding protein [Planctomycetota bacterium]|nr:AMP-binding protein [Planctomycetota bacterium]
MNAIVPLDGAKTQETLVALRRAFDERSGWIALLSPHDGASTATRLLNAMERATSLAGSGVFIGTSGSTNERSWVAMPWESIELAARAACMRTPLSSNDGWLLSLPLWHVGAVALACRCWISNARIIVGAGPSAMSDDLLAHESITHLSVVPTQLSRLLHEPSAKRLGELRTVLVGGAPCPRAVRDAAVGQGIPISMTWGMTETASQISTGRSTGTEDESFAGQPLDHVEVVADHSGSLRVRCACIAPWIVRHESIVPLIDADGWFSTRDRGYILDGSVFITGRADLAFLSGGENVQPEEVEQLITPLGWPVGTVIVGIPHMEWGTQTTALVPHDAAADWEALIDAARASLPPHCVPREVFRMPEGIELSGKIKRAGLSKQAAAQQLQRAWPHSVR